MRARACDACAEPAEIPLCYNFCIFQKNGKGRKADGLLPEWNLKNADRYVELLDREIILKEA